MKTVRRNYIVLLLLSVIFVAPGLSAYLFYAHPTWLHQGTTNRGVLLNPSIKLSIPEIASSKWAMVLWQPNACDNRCVQQLSKLARVRLALGRRLYSLQLILLLDKSTPELSKTLVKTLKERDIQVSKLAHDEKTANNLGNDSRVFIASPSHDLILAYSPTANPGDIYQDIQHLLKQ